MSAVPRLSEHLDDFGLVVALRSFYLSPSILKTLIFELIQMVTWLAISRGVKQLVDFSFNWNHCRRKTSRGAWGLSCCWNDVLCSCLGCLGERGGYNHRVIIHPVFIAWDLKSTFLSDTEAQAERAGGGRTLRNRKGRNAGPGTHSNFSQVYILEYFSFYWSTLSSWRWTVFWGQWIEEEAWWRSLKLLSTSIEKI